jgi:hypothetical protein
MTREDFILRYANEGLREAFQKCIRGGCSVFEFKGIDWIIGLHGIYPEREIDEKKLKDFNDE